MKKIYLILFICIAFLGTKAATFTVTIVSNSAYSPATLTVNIGDMVVIQASGAHPANQVSSADWSAGNTTTLSGGWGSQTNTFTFTATSAGTVYYMCSVHGPFGMKGTITVNAVGVNETAANFLNGFNLFPNPATSNVKVSFGLNEASTVNIKLFNVAGQEVKTFVNDLNLVTGNYEYNFELPQSIASGNYFIEVSSGDRKSTKKLLVSK